MNKIAIPYYNKNKLMLFMLTALIPLLIIMRLSVLFLKSLAIYWLLDIILFVLIVWVWYKLAYMVPFLKGTAYTWVENGQTCLQLKEDGEVKILDQVNEIFLSRPSALGLAWGNKSTMLEIQNGYEKYVLLSPPEGKDVDIKQTVLYSFFLHLQGKNPHLVPETDVKGEPIPYWLKIPTDI